MKSNSINLFSNRQSRATTERLEHYRYDAESGRLRQRIPDRAYEYDAGGRTTADGRLRYRYGAEGRLAEITRAATGQRRAAYRYNALGERVRKVGTSVTYYHYDLEGRLLAETDASGQTRAEYLYLGHAPLALSRSGQLYYYHNDHLGTPQKLTDGAGQVVWSARYRAFGEASIGAGYVTQNLRFPGQYYDEESGLHYNYQRYYDPGTGRYITSDPIGLAGGINPYLYVGANPLKWIDPLGLIWETIDIDYHGWKNWGMGITNRLANLEEGTIASPKNCVGCTRDVIQEWIPHPDDPQNNRNYCAADDPMPGDRRKIKQQFGEFPDTWNVDGKSWHWEPPVPSPTYQNSFEGLYY